MYNIVCYTRRGEILYDILYGWLDILYGIVYMGGIYYVICSMRDMIYYIMYYTVRLHTIWCSIKGSSRCQSDILCWGGVYYMIYYTGELVYYIIYYTGRSIYYTIYYKGACYSILYTIGAGVYYMICYMCDMIYYMVYYTGAVYTI